MSFESIKFEMQSLDILKDLSIEQGYYDYADILSDRLKDIKGLYWDKSKIE